MKLSGSLRVRRRTLSLLFVLAQEGFTTYKEVGQKIGDVGVETTRCQMFYLWRNGYVETEPPYRVTPKGHELLKGASAYMFSVCDVFLGTNEKQVFTDRQVRDLEVRLLTRIPNNEVRAFLRDYDSGLCICSTLDAVARRKEGLEVREYRKTVTHWPTCPQAPAEERT